MKINYKLTSQGLQQKIKTLFHISAFKILNLEKTWNPEKGTPVHTVKGKYATRGWTEWTRGFQYGSALLHYEATGDKEFLDIGRNGTWKFMPGYLTHIGVHDHGFNIISTYGNLLRFMNEEIIPFNECEQAYYKLALKVSGAVQAARWTPLMDELGYIYSFNGPHSLFADTIRSLRSLALSHQLGHVLMVESDQKVNLLERLLIHAETTARYNVYFGTGRDKYDVPGRVAHESIFNLKNSTYRCVSTQQGYSPYSTWTRGLAWIILGYSEQAEYLEFLNGDKFSAINSKFYQNKAQVIERFLQVACVTSDFYIAYTPSDGIPYWDTGAPGLVKFDNYLEKPADPFNDYEPVDSSAAAIAAQGLLRLGHFLQSQGDNERGDKYYQAGLTIADHLFDEPYLARNPDHQGLILHSLYHRPMGWDYIPRGRKIPCGESSMWGDYHARELALYIQRITESERYLKYYL